MKLKEKHILLTGANGFIGKEVAKFILASGGTLHVLGRSKEKEFRLKFPFPCHYYEWKNCPHSPPPVQALSGVHSVVHLMGENIAGGAWTPKRKEELFSSRVDSSKAIISLINTHKIPIESYISASAVGIYGDQGDTILKEESKKGNDFLSNLCEKWEECTTHLQEGRVVNLRLGLVLSSEGGILKKILPLYKFGLGATLGTGNEWISWIHLEDLCHLIIESLINPSFQGPINAVSPNPVTASEWSKILANKVKRWSLFKIPPFALKTLLGELSTLLLSSQRVSPQKVIDLGFHFRIKKLEDITFSKI